MTTLEKIRAEILNFKEKCNASDYLGCGILDIIDKYAEQEPKSPCDLCRYNPPSSCDGKPCTMCPAEKGGE